jgi:hypothetical protein
MVSKIVEFSFHLLLKVAFLVMLFGDFQTVYPQAVIEEPTPVPNATVADPYRAGNCLIDAYLVYQELLENPTRDDIPSFPGTKKNNYNMNCTNPNKTSTNNKTIVSNCKCQDYYSGDLIDCVNQTNVDYLLNTTQQYG